MENVYKCRICYRMFYDKEVVIDLSSDEAKKDQIAAKILSVLLIIVSLPNDIHISAYFSFYFNFYHFVYLHCCPSFSVLSC